MAIKHYNPTTPGRRFSSVTDYSELERQKGTKAPKYLFASKSRPAGRNNSGKITVRHQGGGHRLVRRIVDFSRTGREGIPAKVVAIEYDSTRTAFVAHVIYNDGVHAYVVAPQGLKVGQVITSGSSAEIHPGNRLQLQNIPVGTFVHDVELVPGQGGKIARSAGSYVLLQNIEGGYAILKMPSGELRKVKDTATASIGQVSNETWMNVRIGKAGRMRHMGWRPSVRGKVMNPVDHPHGGGEGHNPIGMKYPKTPWGKHAIGVKTRSKKKPSSSMILQRRKKK